MEVYGSYYANLMEINFELYNETHPDNSISYNSHQFKLNGKYKFTNFIS